MSEVKEEKEEEMKTLAFLVTLFCLSCVKQTPVAEDVHDAAPVIQDVVASVDVAARSEDAVVVSVDAARSDAVDATDASTRDGD